ncbi:MAG: 4-(cytidine 5'-diphospho)-2-C-methyl-D-erythritol kinase [Nitrospirota bacterium]
MILRIGEKELSIFTPAKINLFLKVVGKRDDGYHNILSIFQMISLYDQIILEESAKGIELISDNKDIPVDEKNLAFIAADKIIQRMRNKRGVAIKIIKRIPVAAGLGGGSSDAAAVMVGLNRMWKLGYTKEELMIMGREIGADIPFFFNGPSAMAMGRGDELYPIEGDREWIILVNPDIRVSTKWVYENLIPFFTPSKKRITKGGGFSEDREEKEIFDNAIIEKIRLTKDKNRNNINDFKIFFNKDDSIINDLERVTVCKYPIIKKIKEELNALGSKWSVMTGSGPAVFGIFKSQSEALITKDVLMKRFNWKVWTAKTLNISPYQEEQEACIRQERR